MNVRQYEPYKAVNSFAALTGMLASSHPLPRRYVSVMMRPLLVLLLTFSQGIVAAEEPLVAPIYQPDAMEGLILEYLEKEHPNIDLSEYHYWSLGFDYKVGIWSAHWDCKKAALSCHFGVQVTNEKIPAFQFHGGL